MIITEAKPFGVVKEKLDELGVKKVAVISCNSCARLCGTGGDLGLQNMVSNLSNSGFDVVYSAKVSIMCNMAIEKQELDFDKVRSADAIVSLSCDSGTLILSKLFSDMKIVKALDTRGIGALGENGEIFFVKKFD